MPGMHVVLVLPDVDVFQKSNYTSARGPATLEDRRSERSLPIGALGNIHKILSFIDGPGIARTGEAYLLPQNRPYLSYSHEIVVKPGTISRGIRHIIRRLKGSLIATRTRVS
jgi:hypothetical protein